ncbi:MAG: extracellular solute-binding protein [Ruminococcus sp.]|nr:extracellular solute-binding protein [Ruminococcus sp.]
MNKLKRVLAGAMALTCMISAVSCSEKEKDSNKENNSAQVQEIMEKSYKAIELEAELPFKEANSLIPIGDTGKIIALGFDTTGGQYIPKTYITDFEFLTFEEITLDYGNVENSSPNARFSVTPSGRIFAIVSFTDYGDFELPDYEDPDFDYENFDYEAMEAAATVSHFIYEIDATGAVVSKNEIKGLEKYADNEYNPNGNVYLGESFSIGENTVISINGSEKMIYVTVDNQGNISEPLDFDEEDYIFTRGTDTNGNFVFTSNQDGKEVLKKFDAATMSISPDVVTFDDSISYFNFIMTGSGDYTLYLSTSTLLYGLKEDGTLDEIINWVDSDISGDYVTSVLPVDNGEFIIVERNYTDGSVNLYRLTKRDASEIENVKIINMVVEYSDQETLESVKEFNKTNSEYRIKLEDYNQYYEWDEENEKQLNSPSKQLKQDIATGKDVDIICMSGSTSLFSNLSRKGALVDLYQFLDSEETLSRDDFVPAALAVGEFEGKLTTLAPSFYINTLACKTKFCDKENWTIDEFIETCNNLPEGMKPFAMGNSKQDMFGRLLYGNSDFINYDEATCNFNSPDFIKVLEFCNQFDNPGEGDEIDWENATSEEWNKYYEESEVALLNDKALLTEVYMSDFSEYARAKHAQFGDEITLVGNPTANGTGARIFASMSYAILETSDCKEACWDFIAKSFSEETQTKEHMFYIPATKSAFTKKLDESMEKPYYTDADGVKHEYDNTYYIGGKEIIVKPLTQEERDFLEEYISNVKPGAYYYDDDIDSIINEEVEAYFKGDKSAEATAETIQNRVSILISEQS